MSDINHHDHDHHDHDHGPAQTTQERDNRYWRSLEQWAGDPEFQKLAETEFQSSPLRDSGEDGWARREFLKLMGASMAMATTACIRRPVQKIVPYNKQPEEVTFGIQNLYSSSFFDGNEAMGLLIRTREGRPLKVEGNPEHPLNKGGTSARAQAHILSLYDPERLQGPRRNLMNKERSNFDTINVKYEEADDAIVKALQEGSVGILTGDLASPATRAVVSDFVSAFKVNRYTWSPLNNEDVIEGQRASYGDAVVPFYRFDKAKVIVSVDADFIGTWIAPTTFSHQFTSIRKDPKTMNKLVSFDSNYSLTGANADVRVRIKPSQQLDVVMGLAYEIIVKGGQTRYAGNASVKAALDPFKGAAARLNMEPALFEKIAQDLVANRGASLIVAGGMTAQTAWARSLQIAVNFLNSALDNDGATVDARSAFVALTATHSDLMGLISDINSGKIKTLIIHGVNPVYSFPQSKELQTALRKLKTVVYTGDRMDETARLADYLLPDHHLMEGWGDNEFVRDVIAIQQPTIRPMYDTRSFQLSLMTWAYLAKQGPKRLTDNETFYDYLRAYWKSDVHPKHGGGKSFEAFWDEALQKGIVGEDSPGKGSGARGFRVESLNQVKPVKAGGDFELVLYPTIMFMDGSLANVPWLHELPDPITKITWDNYASVSIKTAEKLKLKEGDMLSVTANGVTTKLPTHIQPGLHDGVVAIAVGYGRTAAGKVGNNIGYNAYELAEVAKDGVHFAGHDVKIEKARGNYRLASVQMHHTMEGRQIVVEATLQQYLKDPGANIHRHAVFSIWSPHSYNGHRWGMAIDTNVCTGCSACMIACQSENNVPVVGKKYVLQGREMHWLRIDRYYVGTPEEAQTVFQPVLCQQCETAPCESVCPVLATTHSSEGLNDMVYNRCVGTRYCSNNCPYKVRRFNWFNYAKNIEKPMHMALNPDVTVRSRGVMEKCTFCVHRIKSAKIKAKVESRELKDGEFTTACAQACPTGGIVFGDLNDPESKVSQIMKNEKRHYGLLEEFNTQPRVRYLSKIRNVENDPRFEQSHHQGGHA